MSSGVPKLYRDRVADYRKQNGCKRLTAAQRRRAEHKKRHRRKHGVNKRTAGA